MLIFLVTCLVFIPVSYAGFFDWFIGLGESITGAVSTEPNITVGGVEPVIENISFQSGTLTPSEGATQDLIFSFLAMDANGCSEFDNTSAFMNVSRGDGGETRTNNTAGDDVTCYPEPTHVGVTGTNATAQNYTCTITMQYWDVSDHWNCTAHIGSGSSADTRTNTTLLVQNCFTWGTHTAVNITNATVGEGISWDELSNNDVDQLSRDELNITNVGNQNITNVTLTAFNLIGEKVNTEWIPAENFTASWADNQCDWGMYLANNTELEVIVNGSTGGYINFGSPTAAQGTSMHNSTIYICLEHVGTAEQISGQSYSTAGDIDDWDISVAASGPA